jgi:predicted aspartyl protease
MRRLVAFALFAAGIAPCGAIGAGLPDAAALILPAIPRASSLIPLSHDAADRMTVPVMVDGDGPFAFVIDTGADRSAISGTLAARLHLLAGPTVLVSSTCDSRAEQTATIADLSVGGRVIHDVHAPVLSREAIGADGILGIDALRGQRMVMNFRNHQLSVQSSRMLEPSPGAIVVTARNRYGQLILLDANVEGIPVYVILDSGAETSIVNSTFRQRMEDGLPANAGHKPALILSVTGGSNGGQFGQLSALTLGDATINNLPVVYSDVYTFRLFHLEHRPAMLLGMDALRVFDHIEVDYPNREVKFSRLTVN